MTIRNKSKRSESQENRKQNTILIALDKGFNNKVNDYLFVRSYITKHCSSPGGDGSTNLWANLKPIASAVTFGSLL